MEVIKMKNKELRNLINLYSSASDELLKREYEVLKNVTKIDDKRHQAIKLVSQEKISRVLRP